MNIVHNRTAKHAHHRHGNAPGRQWKIGDVLLWWRSHVYGLKINRGFDAHAVEVPVEPLLCSPARQMSRSPRQLIDDIAVIDEPPHLAYQRGAEADLIDPNGA